MKEKLARAFWSSNLEVHEWTDSATTIAAAGASQIKHGQRHLGFLLHRIQAGQSKYLPEALTKFMPIVWREARRNAWKGMTEYRVATLAQIALDAFLWPSCPSCRGIGQMGGYDQTIVAICQSCKGTGKRRISKKENAELLRFDIREYSKFAISERIKDLVDVLSRMYGHATDAARRQTRY